jgi:hypothetical protein
MRTSGIAIVVGFLFAALCAPLAAQTYPMPFVNNPLVPAATPPGGPGFMLTVNGAGFVSGDVVKWSGSPRVTTFVSNTRLTAQIPASDIATAATVSVTVANPSGGTSNSVLFQVTTPTTSLAFTRTDYKDANIIGPTAITAIGPSDLAVANTFCNQTCNLGLSTISFISNSPGLPAFVYTGLRSPVAIGVADLTGNGGQDFITVGSDGFSVIRILIPGTTGTHQAYPFPPGTAPSNSFAVGDFRGNGHLDLVLLGNSGLTVLPGNGDGTFGSPANYDPGTVTGAVATGDFNGDGKLDLAVSNILANTISILLGNGDGTFQSPVDYSTGPFPGNIVIADFNGDGNQDLAVVSNNANVSIFLGNGNGTFQPKVDYPAGTAIESLTIGDFNGDGIPDIAVSDAPCTAGFCLNVGSVNVLLGNGDGTFQSHLDFATGIDPESIAAGEFLVFGQAVGRSGFATANNQDNTVSIFNPILTGPVNSVPTTSSISPSSVQVGSGGFTLTVNGTNFVTGATVLLNGTARPTTFVSSTQLTAQIFVGDVASAGSFGVNVSNPPPGGGSSTSIAFGVFLPPPTISSLSPPSVVMGGPAFTLTVNGLNFVNGAVVNFNGAPRSTTFVSSMQVTIAISASDITSQGTINISVTDPPANGGAGGTSSTLTLTILPTTTQPVIGALVPASATAGGPAFTLQLTGTGFTASSVVTFKSSVVSSAFVNATLLQAAIPASDIAVAGTPLVTVANPGGSPSLVTSFFVNNPVPGASSLSPSSVPAGGAAVTLNVTGTNFTTSSTVLVNGSSRATTYVSSTSLNAALPAGDFSHGGTLNIMVNNPTPGGGTTSAISFTVADYSVSGPSTPTPPVAAGQPANFSLTVAPSNGAFSIPVTLMASGLPTGATATFLPSATITPGSTPANVTLSITTMARSSVPPLDSPRGPGASWPSLYLIVAVLGAMGLALRVSTGRMRRLAPQFLLALLLVLAGGLVACGGVAGGGTSSQQVNQATGTPAGTYPILVTATSGGVTHTTTVTLTVY